MIGSAKPGHAGLDFSTYVAAIDGVDGAFDVIVIDGRAREACLQRAVTRLAPDGLIVFDNVDRQRYRDAIGTLGGRVVVTIDPRPDAGAPVPHAHGAAPPRAAGVTRARALDAARILFVLLTVGFAWWGFRGRWDDIGDAVADTSPVGLAAAVLVTMLGLCADRAAVAPPAGPARLAAAGTRGARRSSWSASWASTSPVRSGPSPPRRSSAPH